MSGRVYLHPSKAGCSGGTLGRMSETSTPDAARALGFIALGELSSFEGLSTDAQYAGNVRDSLELARLAAAEIADVERLLERITALGHDAGEVLEERAAAAARVRPGLDPRDWYESLMKRYVFDAIVRDVSREVAGWLDPESAELVRSVLDDSAQLDYLARRLGAAVADDEQLAGRLALWGRRLVGEAIGSGQAVLRNSVFASPEVPGIAAAEDTQTREAAMAAIVSHATANHSLRMSGLGLVA